VEAQATIILKELKSKFTSYYADFQPNNPSFILLHHHYLFQTQSLQQYLTYSFDNLPCWLHSVKEAIFARDFQDTWERENADSTQLAVPYIYLGNRKLAKLARYRTPQHVSCMPYWQIL
jgi:hypothetical protein